MDSQNSASIIGYISEAEGTILVANEKGEIRTAQVGDPLFLNETVVNDSAGKIAITLVNNQVMYLTPQQQIDLSVGLFDSTAAGKESEESPKESLKNSENPESSSKSEPTNTETIKPDSDSSEDNSDSAIIKSSHVKEVIISRDTDPTDAHRESTTEESSTKPHHSVSFTEVQKPADPIESSTPINLNDIPTSLDKTVTINEDNSHTFSTTDFAFSDQDTGDSLQSITITSLPAAGTLELNTNPVTLNQVITASDISNLIFTPVAQASGTGYASFGFTVSDGTDSSTAQTLTLDVTPVTDTTTVTLNNNIIDTNVVQNGDVATTSEWTTSGAISLSNGRLQFGSGSANSDGVAEQGIYLNDGLDYSISLDYYVLGSLLTESALIEVIDSATGSTLFSQSVSTNSASAQTLNANFTTTSAGFATLRISDTSSGSRPSTDLGIDNISLIPEAANNAGYTPTVSVPEDQPVPVELDIANPDTDGSETLAIQLTGIPSGIQLSDGTNNFTSTGAAIDVSSWNLNNLVLTPPANYDNDFTMTATATATETATGAQVVTNQAINIHIQDINAPPVITALNPVTDVDAAFSFSEGTGTTAEDISGNSQDLSMSGSATWGTSRSGSGTAFEMNGTSGAGEISGVQTGGAMTIAAWVRFDSFTQSWSRVIDFGDGQDSNNILIGHEFTTGDLGFHVHDSGGTQHQLTVSNFFTTGEWVHMVATIDSTGLFTVYKNGEQAGTVQGGVPTEKVRNFNYVGKSNWSGDGYLDGAIDDLAVISGALDATGVSNLYQASQLSDFVDANFVIDENSSNGTVVAQLSANDEEDGTNVTYTLVNNAGGRFAISSTGEITVADSSLLDHETTGSHTLRVRVTDSGGLTNEQDVVIQIADINEAPTAIVETSADNPNIPNLTSNNDQGFIVSASGEHSASYAAFRAFDGVDASSADNTGSWAVSGSTGWLQVDTGSPTAIWKYDLKAIGRSQGCEPEDWQLQGSNDGINFDVIDTQSGINNWTVREVKEFELTTPAIYRYYRLNITDNNGDSFTGLDGFQIHQDITLTDQNTPLTLDVLANDIDQDDTDDVSNFSLDSVVIVDGSDNPVTGQGTATVVNNEIQFDPGSDFAYLAGGENATVNLRYTMSDDEGATSTVTTSITVNGINDAPVIDETMNTLDVNVDEDNSQILQKTDILYGFSDADDDTLGIQSLSVDTGTLTDNGNDTWTYTPPANFHGTATFTIEVSDGALSVTANKTITVTSINDIPTSLDKTVTINEDNSHTFSTTDFAFSDQDTGDSLQSITITSLPAAGTLELNTNPVTLNQVITASDISNLIFTPVAQASGTGYASFGFTVSDGTDSSTAQTLTLDVTPVTDTTTVTLNNNIIDTNVVQNGDVATTSEWTTSGAISLSNGRLQFGSGSANSDGVAEQGIYLNDGLDYSISLDYYVLGSLLTESALIEVIDSATGSTLFSQSVSTNSASAQTLNANFTTTSAGFATLRISDTSSGSRPSTDLGIDNISLIPEAANNAGYTPTVSVPEDQPVPVELDIANPDTDGSETLAIQLTGIPSGIQLSDGTNNFTSTGAAIDVSSWNLNNLVLTPPANYDNDFTMTATATATETATGAQVVTNQAINIHIQDINAPPVITALNPVTDVDAAFSFSEGTGTTAEDISGNSQDLSMSGSATWGTSRSGSGTAFEMNGTSGAGEISGVQTGGAMTIAAWVRFDSFTQSWSRVIDFGDGQDSNNILIGHEITTGDLGFHVHDSGGTQHQLTVSNFFTTGEWVHMVATIDSTGLFTVYKNGEQAGTVQGGVPTEKVRNFNYVGKSNWSGDGYLDGAIDDLAVISGALDATGVSNLYQASQLSDFVDANFVIDENSSNGTVVAQLSANDEEDGTNVTYTLVNNAGGRFAISSTGEITVADSSLLDHETTGSHTLRVRVTDSGGLTNEQDVVIQIADINEAPTAIVETSADNPNIPNLTSNNDQGFIVSASGEHSASYAAFRAFDGVDASSADNTGSWAVSGSTGWLQVDTGSPTAIWKYDLKAIGRSQGCEPEDWQLQGSNDGINFDVIDTQSGINNWTVREVKEFELTTPAIYRYYRLNITDNNGDSFTGLDGFQIHQDITLTDQNTPLTLDVLANDIDQDDTDDVSNFSLDSVVIVDGSDNPVTGQGTATVVNNEIQFDPGSDFAYLAGGENATVNLRYTMSDDEGATSTVTTSITVNGINDAPVIDETMNTLDVNVDEDNSQILQKTDILYGFSDADDDTLGIQSLSVDTGTLTDNGNDTWTYTPPANFHGTATFTIEVSDGALSVTANKTITVTSINDIPTSLDKTVTINEDNSHTFSTTDFAFSDQDTGDSLQSITITSLPAAGTLELNTNPVTLNQVITAADISNLVFTPVAQASGTGYASFGFTVSDGTDSSTAQTLTLDVTPVTDTTTVTLNNNIIDTNVVQNGDVATTSEWTTSGAISLSNGRLQFGSGSANSDGVAEQGIYLNDGLDYSISLDYYVLGSLLTESALIEVIDSATGSTLFSQSVSTNSASAQTLNANFTTTSAGFATLRISDTSSGSRPSTDLGIDNISLIPEAANNAGYTPTVSVPEDQPVPVELDIANPDTDGSETLAIQLTGIPSGIQLSDGTNNFTSTGAAIDVSSWNLNNLVLTPPANYDNDFTMTATATATETATGAQVVTNQAINIHIHINAPPVITALNPVTDVDAAFSFSEGTGTTAEDISGNSQDLSMSGSATWGTSRSGSGTAFEMNGTSGAGEISGVQTGGAMTIAAWVRFDSFTQSWSRVIDFGDGQDSNNILIGHEITTGDLGFHVHDSGGTQHQLTVSNFFTTGEWVHMVATIDSTGLFTVYKNGEQAGTVQGGVPTEKVRNFNYVGKSNWSGDGYLDGAIDDLAVISGALDATGVSNLYQASQLSDFVDANFVIDENSSNGTVVAQLSANDEEDGTNVTYTLVNNAGGRFAISSTGEITVADSSLLDHETTGSHTLRVRVTDSGGLTNEQDVVIQIADINEAPTAIVETSADNPNIPNLTSNNDQGFIVSASGEHSASYAAFRAFDGVDASSADNTGSWAVSGSTGWLQVDTGSPTAIWKYDLKAIGRSQGCEPEDWQLQGSNDGINFDVIDTQSGINNWTVREVKEFELTTPAIYRYYRLNITDNNGDSFTGLDGFQIHQDITLTDQNTPLTLDVLANDIDQDDTDDVSNFSLDSVVIVDGSDNPVTGQGTATVVNNEIQFDPGSDFAYLAGGENATVNLRYTMSDDEGATSTVTTSITVNGINDAPVIDETMNTLDVNVDEDNSQILQKTDILYGFSDADDDTLGIQSLSVDTGTLTDNGNDTWTYTPPANFHGTATFTIEVSDGALSVTANKTITVTSINDIPTSLDKTVTINEDNSHTFSTTDFAFSDQDTGDSLQSITITSLPAAGTLELNTNPVTLNQVITAADISNLVFTPVAQASGTGYASFGFTVSDGTDSSTAQTLTLDVTPVTDTTTVTLNNNIIDTNVVQNGDVATTSEWTTSGAISLSNGRLQFGSGFANSDGVAEQGIYLNDGLDYSISLDYYVLGSLLTESALIEVIDSATGSTLFSQSVSTNSASAQTLNANFTTTSAGFATLRISDTSSGSRPSTDLGIDNISLIPEAANNAGYTPTVSVPEDQPVPVELDIANPDTDGSETLAIQLTGIPSGIQLSDGTNNFTSTGAAIDVSSWNLNNLVLTPPANYDNDFTMTATATATETATGAQVVTNQAINIHIHINAPPVITALNPVTDVDAAFSFSEGTGTTAEDISGNSQDLSMSGSATWGTSRSGSGTAFEMNGTSGAGEISGVQTGGAMTIAAWVRFDSFTQSWSRVIDFGDGQDSNNILIGHEFTTGDLGFHVHDSGGTQHQLTVSNFFTTGEWVHMVATIDSTGLFTVYKNGEQAGTVQGGVPTEKVRNFNYVGKSNFSGDGYLDGAIDDLAVISGALDATGVSNLYQASQLSDFVDANFVIDENSSNGTVVAQLSANDEEDGTNVTYTLVNNAGGRFAISSTGEITVADSSLLDHETTGSHTLRVRVTDSGGLTDEQDVVIQIADINEAPTAAVDISDTNPTIPDLTSNNDQGYVVSASGTAGANYEAYRAFDATEADAVNNQGSWTVGGSTGWLQVDTGEPITIWKYDLKGIVPASRQPKDWQLQGSNDGVNFDVIDTQSNINNWTSRETKEFELAGSATYRYFRLNITDNNGDSFTGLDGFQLYEGIQTTTDQNTAFTLNVLANDIDQDDTDDTSNFSLDSVVIVDGSDNPVTGQGTATVVNNEIQFDPGSDFAYLAGGENATVNLRYTMSDDEGATSTITTSITVNGINDAPVIDETMNTLDVNAAYTFTEGSGTTAADHSGDNQPMTLSGNASWGTSRAGSGTAFEMDGTSGSGEISGLQTGGEMTISTWVRFDSFAQSWSRVIDFGDSASVNNILIGHVGTTNELGFHVIDSGGTSHNLNIANFFTAGEWVHITATVDSSGLMTVYKDGVEAGSLQGAVPTDKVRTFNYVGRSNWSQDDFLDGAIDDLIILNESVDATEANNLFQSTQLTDILLDIDEHSASSTVVGTVPATELDTSDTLTYTLLDDAGGRFSINSSNGEITIADGSLLDFDDNKAHKVRVRVTDDGNPSLSDEQDVTIVVNNINEIDGTSAADTLTASASPVILRGLEGNDILTGWSGDDILLGGSGDDVMTGGTGRDEFRFEINDIGTAINPAEDTIIDFNTAENDTLNLADLLIDEENNDLSQYLSFDQTDPSNPIVEVRDTAGGDITQRITLQGVDLSLMGNTDAEIINNLLNNGNLNTD